MWFKKGGFGSGTDNDDDERVGGTSVGSIRAKLNHWISDSG
jgi:hypothetical protein